MEESNVERDSQAHVQEDSASDYRRVPVLRFRGFTYAWERRKLGEVYGSIGNAFVGTATPYYVEYGHFYLESNNVKDGQINRNSEIFINDDFYEKQKDKLLHAGDMVMVQSGHVGHAAVITEELDNTAAHALIMFRNPKEEIEPYFLNYEYQTDKAKKKIENITIGNTIKHILASDMQEFVVDVPKHEEQQVIASYYRTLDRLVALHQRKLHALHTIKKALLEKMFPTPGSDIPEIRFQGFTETWKQQRLGEFFLESDERSSTMEILSVSVANGIYPASESDRDTNPGASLASYKVVRKGDIVYNSMRMWQGAVGSSIYDGIVSPAYVVARPAVELDSSCFGYLLKQPEMLYRYLCDSQGNSKDTQTLRFSRFAEIKAEIPPTLDEQQAISTCLGTLDHLVTLYQHKLNKLHNIKKALLEKMFV